jgi:hypothetical protein
MLKKALYGLKSSGMHTLQRRCTIQVLNQHGMMFGSDQVYISLAMTIYVPT